MSAAIICKTETGLIQINNVCDVPWEKVRDCGYWLGGLGFSRWRSLFDSNFSPDCGQFCGDGINKGRLDYFCNFCDCSFLRFHDSSFSGGLPNRPVPGGRYCENLMRP